MTGQLGTSSSVLGSTEQLAPGASGSGGTIHTETVSQTMSLVQTATGTKEVHVTVAQTLNLVQSVAKRGPVYVSVAQTLNLLQTLTSNMKVVSVRQNLNLVQSDHPGLNVTETVNQVMALVDQASRVIEVTVSQALNLTQNGQRSNAVSQVLNLVQTVSVGKGGADIYDILKLLQSVVLNTITSHSVADVMALRQSANYYLVKSNYRCTYAPYVGVTTDPTYPTPNPVAPTLGTAKLTLTYPFVSPTQTLVLRNPDWGNRTQLAFSRIYRETRGGKLLVFGDPTWPKQQTLLIQVEALSAAQISNLKTFLIASLGQQIGLLDWENRQWKGVIMNPDTALIQNGRQNRTVSLTFQGTLA